MENRCSAAGRDGDGGGRVADLVVGAREVLCLPTALSRFTAALFSAPAVESFGPVVQSLMLPMLDARHDLALCGAAAAELVL
jgi:hypothetical protein